MVGMQRTQRGHPLSTWLRWPGKVVSESHRFEIFWERESSWQATILGHHTAYWNAPLVFLGKSLWGAGFRFTTHLEAAKMLSVNVSWGGHLGTLPWPHYSLLVPPGKEPVHLSGATIFDIFAKGITPDCLVWRLAGVQLRSHRTVYICTSQKLLTEGLASNQPKTQGWLRSLFQEHSQVLAYPLQLGPTEKKIKIYK